MSAPITPQPSHASLPDGLVATAAASQASSNMTPPPSTQVPLPLPRIKSRTPTPTSPYSRISTPPPTIEASSQGASARPGSAYARTMTADQIASASTDDLRAKLAEFQAAYQEAKMSAAHHRLQYRMLAQESAAAIERMAVEARMAQYENEVIHVAEQAKAAVSTTQPSPAQDGTIPVQKDLYQRMCREIQHLTETNSYLEAEHRQQEKIIQRQETEIASLSDKVTLMRERIRENREHQNRFRSTSLGRHNVESTPRSIYSTPRRAPHGEAQAQPFAALLQASEMASQEAGTGRSRGPSAKAGHKRNIHSLSSLPATPTRPHKQPPLFQTPQPRRGQPPLQVPATAPVARTSALRNPDVYAQHALSMQRAQALPSDGTVSASDNEAEDSEAETDIIEPEAHEVGESQASRAASQMLRSSQEHEAQRSFQGRGMLAPQTAGSGMRQGKLFGAVRKAGVVRAGEDEPPNKRARTGEGIGLGIAGVKQ